MSGRPWHLSPEKLPRKRPYSPPHSPGRTTRMRNAIHKDVLFEQGVYPTYGCFSARGSRAISCFKDGFTRVWNVDPVHGRFLDCEQVLRHGETVYRAAISDCGTRAVTTAGDGVARVWELTKPNCPSQEIGSHFRSTRSCDISSDGKYVAATFYTGKKAPVSRFQGVVVLYDPEHDSEFFRKPVSGIPDKVRVSRDGRVVAVGCYGVTPEKGMARDTRLTLFDEEGEVRFFFPRCLPDEGACVAWDLSDDGRFLAICAKNRSVIELYSELTPKQWASSPRILAAKAPLIYEKVRIVDNGDLVTALALDTMTKERSLLVFRPSTGDVLFSLACGLKDPKACVDLEPRVCYVAASYERAERKVVRLISRTGGATASLKLVRCGDPPKNASHDTSMIANSAPPSSSMERLSSSARLGEKGFSAASPAPRLLDDSPTPARPLSRNVSPTKPQRMTNSPIKPQQMNVSPARPRPINISPNPGNAEPVTSTILPIDDQFSLDKRNDGDTIMVDVHGKAPTTGQASPILSTSNLSNDTSPTRRMSELPGQESPMKESNDINKQPAQSVQAAGGSTSEVTKTLQLTKSVYQAPENKPTTPDSKSKSSELAKAKMEKLLCKSTIAAKRLLQNSSPLHIAIGTGNAEDPSSTERDKASEPKEAIVPACQTTNISNEVTEKQDLGQTNTAADLNNLTAQSNALQIASENNDVAGKKTDYFDPQSTGPNTEMKQSPNGPTPNLKRPRWQRMINKQTAVSRDRRNEVNSTLTAEVNGNSDQCNISFETKTEDTEGGDISRVNGILHNSPSTRPSEESPAWQGPVSSPAVQGAIDLDTLPSDEPTKTRASTADVGGVTASLHRTESPVISRGSTAEDEAKTEAALLTYSNVGSSPQPLPTASRIETREVKPTYEVKQEATNVYKNRYFITLEAAKTLFRQIAHELEGEQVVSNVKGFKTMMELLRDDSQLIDRKTIARIVYEKGGMRDAINEASFLEAFSVLYDEVQEVRQRLWSKVYEKSGAEEEGLLVFHARDLVTRECLSLGVQLNPVWNCETLDEVIASYCTDGVLVDRNAFVQAADHIFSI